MQNLIPGTAIESNPIYESCAFAQIEPVFSLTGGLTLAQVRAVTGLESSTIQNWIRRGWVAPPVSKLYSKQSLLRILLINSVRGALQIERIAELMEYINGDALDTSDDIISDEQLFNIFCSIIFSLKNQKTVDLSDENMLNELIKSHLGGYEEKETGSVIRLQRALYVMTTAYFAAGMTQISNNAYENLIANK